ncbi:MAG: hypothetical protein M5R36_02405 [Deltaproteobacteria bacterium]|nr:hypothetical protein [Deltaproteobacteria bacterium]
MRRDKAGWKIVQAPGSGYGLYAFDLADKDNGLAAGRNDGAAKGAVTLYSGGTWYTATVPDASLDWTLTGAAVWSATSGLVVGKAYDVKTGIAVSFESGTLTLLNLPLVSADWSLEGVAASGDVAIACGADREHDEGVILGLRDNQWFVDARSPFRLFGVRAF